MLPKDFLTFKKILNIKNIFLSFKNTKKKKKKSFAYGGVFLFHIIFCVIFYNHGEHFGIMILFYYF
jgi:hypothetical protein